MNRRGWTTLALVGAFVGVIAVSYFTGMALSPQSGFTGSDSVATTTVQESQPGYEPWFQPIFAPPSGEIESGLFALLAAVGAGVLGFVLGRFWERRNSSSDPAAQPETTRAAAADLAGSGESPETARVRPTGEEPS